MRDIPPRTVGVADFRGGSGALYRYLDVESETAIPLGAGNFLYVRADAAGAVLLYAGQAERLTSAISERWREAAERHGATHLYARRNVLGGIRRQELADLLEAHAPVMNRTGPAGS